MKLRHIIIIIIFVLVNFLILGVILVPKLLLSKTEDESKEKQVFVKTLSATKVTNANESFQVVGFGEVSSYNALDVSAEAQGRLSKGKFDLKPGIKFSKGDLLYSLDDTEFRFSLRSRKSAFINLIASILPDIKIDFSGEFDKWNAYVSSIKLNKTLPQLPNWTSEKEKIFLASKNILTEYFAIKSLEEQLKKFSFYAPFSGVITDVYVNNYAVVNPGTRIMSIGQNSNFEISISVPVAHLNNIKKGSKAQIYTTSDVFKGEGQVVRVSDVINKTTQSVQLFIKPSATEGQKFTNGEYVKVKVNVDGEYNGVRLPSAAIKNSNVYVYNPSDSLLKMKEISVLNENEDGTFVSGLNDNNIVITQEVLAHQDSTKYKVLIK